MKNKLLPLLLLAVSIISLGFAAIAQYGFGLKPCILCLYQRIPYAIVMVLSLVALSVTAYTRVRKILMLLCIVSFIAGAAIAFYHVGVEQHIFLGTSTCANQSSMPVKTIEEMRRQILNAPVVRCDQPAFVWLGLSMAGWNGFWSLFLAGFSLYLYRSQFKRW